MNDHPRNTHGCCDGSGQVHHGEGALHYVTLCTDPDCAQRRQDAWDNDPQIVVTRSRLFSRTPGNLRPFSNYYECEGPDGKKYTNTDIGTLRSLLRSRYPGVQIIESWKTGA